MAAADANYSCKKVKRPSRSYYAVRGAIRRLLCVPFFYPLPLPLSLSLPRSLSFFFHLRVPEEC